MRLFTLLLLLLLFLCLFSFMLLLLFRRVNSRRKIHLTRAVIRGRSVIRYRFVWAHTWLRLVSQQQISFARFVVCSRDTTEEDVHFAVKEIKEAARTIIE